MIETRPVEVAGQQWRAIVSIPVRRRQRIIKNLAAVNSIDEGDVSLSDSFLASVDRIDTLLEIARDMLHPDDAAEIERRIDADNLTDPIDVDDVLRIVTNAMSAWGEADAEATGAPLDGASDSKPNQPTRRSTEDFSETASISTQSTLPAV